MAELKPSPFKRGNRRFPSGMTTKGGLLQQGSVFVGCFGFVGGDYHGGGYLVVGVEV